MKWPWEPRPGVVRISQKRYIELLQGALRSHELDARAREHQLQIARAVAERRVYEAGIARRVSQAEEPVLLQIAADPPLTRAGDLHEPALEAAFDQALWSHRERELERLSQDR